MAVGRTTQVTIGADAFDVSTKLRTGDIPTIETLVSRRGRIVFRTSRSVEDLKPIFAHSEEILQRVEAQHVSVLGEIEAGRLTKSHLATTPTDAEQEGQARPTKSSLVTASSDAEEAAERILKSALAHMGRRDFQLAEAELQHLMELDPGYTEANDLLEIVKGASSQRTPPVTSLSDRLRAGAEALTRGWKSSAIQNWARGLSADPANRIFQLLVLLTTTPSPERRTRHLRELLAISKDLLGGDRSEEAHALLLALQAIEDPDGASPQLAVHESQAPSDSKPTTRRHVKPTDTQPSASSPPSDPESSWPTRGGSTADPSSENPLSALVVSERADVSDSTEDGEHDAQLAHPEREAALFEASQAEGEARERKPRPLTSLMPARSSRGIWARLATRTGIALSAISAVVLAVATLLVLWPGRQEEGRAEIERAAALAALGQFRPSIALYDQVIARGQLRTVAYLGRGRARLATGDVEEGLSDLAQAARLAPDSVEILEELADGLYASGQFDEAVGYYERAMARGRDSANVRYRLAASLVQLNRAEEALPQLETAIAREPSHGEARYLYGKLLNDAGRYAEAEKEIRGARAQFDPGADYFVELAIALLEQGKFDGAEELARQLEHRDPSDARAHTLLGEIYLGRRRLDASRNELIVALQTNAEQPRAHLALARVWLAFGQANKDPAELLKARQILEEKHGIPEAKRLLALGEVSLSEGQPERAVELLERALTHGCERLPAQLTLAEARFASGDLDGAAQELEAADVLAPEDAAIALSLGLIHSQRKDFLFASREYLKALHRIGLTQPVQENSGPVILPAPYLTLPAQFDLDRVIRDAYRRALAQDDKNEIAAALKDIAETTSFLIGGPA